VLTDRVSKEYLSIHVWGISSHAEGLVQNLPELYCYYIDSWIHILRHLQLPGLSDRIEIKSSYVIESNVFAQIESNRIQIEPNDFFDFWYDLIRFDLDKNLNMKNLKLRQEKTKNSQNRILKGTVRYICFHSGQFFWKLVFLLIPDFLSWLLM
jgi:hypothetical protein